MLMRQELLFTIVCCTCFCTSLLNHAAAQSCTNLSGTIRTQSQTSTCSGDAVADIVSVTVTGSRGTNYALILTDAFDRIQRIENSTGFNMEGWHSNVYNVRG